MIALPVMAQMLIQNLVSLIDNFMVSGLGDIKMSGVNISGQLLFVFMVFMNTVCMSGGIFLTQFAGAKNKEGMKQSFCFKLLFCFFALLLFLFVCMVVPRTFLSLMVMGNSQAEEIIDVAAEYMFLMGFIGLPMALSSVISSSLREIGKVKVPLVISVIATCVNTFFNWVLIYGNLGAPRLEVRGAAYATIIARCIEMLLFVIYVMKNKPPFSIGITDLLHINFKLFREILKKGSMIFVSEMMWVLSETITTALYNGRGGADVVSGMAAGFAIANLFFVAFGGINTATSIIIGQTLGQGKLDEARSQKTWLLNAAFLFGCFMSLFGLATMLLVPVVFGNLSESARGITNMMVLVMSVFMPVWVYVNAQFSVSRAGGDTVMGMLIDLSANLGLVLPGMFIMANLTNFGPVLMYTIIKFSDFLKILIAHFWLKKEKWVKNLAEDNKVSGAEAAAV
ncbi:MAG: MATE family efflux transporter [Treponemataceae bacterium]|nr:MATE family efflux transporter [Treponemataceae bacterium]